MKRFILDKVLILCLWAAGMAVSAAVVQLPSQPDGDIHSSAASEKTGYDQLVLKVENQNTNPAALDLKKIASRRWREWRTARSEYFTIAWQALYRYAGTTNEYKTYSDAGLTAAQVPFDRFDVASGIVHGIVLGSWEDVYSNYAKLASYVIFPSPESTKVTAYMLRDEPPASLFPSLAAATAYIYRHDVRKAIPIVDQLPNWAVNYDRFGLGNADGSYYRTYINKYVRDVCPCVMLNDHYPLFVNAPDSTNYYENIEYFRGLALTNDIGLMGFALVTSHTNGSRIYRQPSESDLNWMVYGYLAYGADGMFFYNYRFSPTATYGEGMVTDADDTPRASYYLVQAVNRELNHLWPVFKHLRSEAVFHVGSAVPFGATGYKDGASTVISKFAGDNFILGAFTNQDDLGDTSKYLVLVNKRHGAGNTSESLAAKAAFKAGSNLSRVSQIDPATGIESFLTPVNGWYAVTLGGGKGALLRFRP